MPGPTSIYRYLIYAYGRKPLISTRMLDVLVPVIHVVALKGKYGQNLLKPLPVVAAQHF